MKNLSRVVIALSIVGFVWLPVLAQQSRDTIEIIAPKDYKQPPLVNSPKLQTILSSAVTDVLSTFPGKAFDPKDVAATLIDLRDPNAWQIASVRGNERIYPASVIKMFYMTALERQLEDGKITMTPELNRGLHDMIVDSSNEATQYILDVLTDTSSGAELPQNEFDKWQYKRNRVNRFFASMGYQNINVNQKTFCEDAYGIEQQSRHYKGENRNMLTTDAVARLMSEIVLGRMNTADRTKAMMDLMKRDPFKETKDPDDQGHGFTGKLFVDRKMTEAKLWSKAGWTDNSRHDAAYIETADGLKFVVVIFTEHHSKDADVIPSVVGKVIDGMRSSK
jgi:beta-lactamase class A